MNRSPSISCFNAISLEVYYVDHTLSKLIVISEYSRRSLVHKRLCVHLKSNFPHKRIMLAHIVCVCRKRTFLVLLSNIKALDSPWNRKCWTLGNQNVLFSPKIVAATSVFQFIRTNPNFSWTKKNKIDLIK